MLKIELLTHYNIFIIITAFVCSIKYTERNNIQYVFGLEYANGSRLSKNHQVIHKYLHYDEENTQFIWRPGKTAGAAKNEEIKAAYLRIVRNWLHYECAW